MISFIVALSLVSSDGAKADKLAQGNPTKSVIIHSYVDGIKKHSDADQVRLRFSDNSKTDQVFAIPKDSKQTRSSMISFATILENKMKAETNGFVMEVRYEKGSNVVEASRYKINKAGALESEDLKKRK